MIQERQEFKINTGEDEQQLMLIYLLSSNYFQYLRNTYKHFLRFTEKEKLTLLKSAEIFRIKEDKATMMINYNQPTISIIIYGELKYEDKNILKGNYFVSPQGQLQVQFLKKTSILMLNKAYFQEKVNYYEAYYQKLDILQKIFPIGLLAIDKRRSKIIIRNSLVISHKNKKNSIINDDENYGIFILFEGNYVILKDNMKLAQVHKDYFGQQSLWKSGYDYLLQSQSHEYSYIFIPRVICMQVFNPEIIMKMKSYYDKKKQSRDDVEKNYTDNLQFTHRFLKQIKEKPKIKQFKEEQISEFNEILMNMSKKRYKPKWRIQQQKLQEQKVQKMRENRIYIPKKVKSRYFSNITGNQYTNSRHQTRQFQGNKEQYKLKLYLHQRSKTEQVFRKEKFDYEQNSIHINSNTLRRTSTDKGKIKTFNTFYSQHYDRALSLGMGNLSKMRKYDNLKKESTLKRGQNVLSLDDKRRQLSLSFQHLQSQSIMASSNRRKMDSKTYLQRTLRNNKLLTTKLFESSKSRFIITR